MKIQWAIFCRVLKGCCVAGIVSLSGIVVAAEAEEEVTVKVVPVTKGIYMLQGQGGNIGVSVGRDGVFMIDDLYAPMSKAVSAAVARLSDKPVRFLINTHWHDDHSGGNEHFGKSGATIVAHDNVRERLLKGEPAPSAALPVVTFADAITFHWNNDTLNVEHVSRAHTDGDAVIYFTLANVVHTGDIYFNGLYPFIDTSSGGDMAGVIEGVATILQRIDNKTHIIPGHGPLSNKAGLQRYHDMLVTVYQRVKAMKDKGQSLEQVKAAKPTAEFDAKWAWQFMTTDKWLSVVYTAI